MGVQYHSKCHTFENKDMIFISSQNDLKMALKEAFPSRFCILNRKYVRYSFQNQSVYLVPHLEIIEMWFLPEAIDYLFVKITEKISLCS